MINIMSDRNRRLTDKSKKMVGYLVAGYPDCDSFFKVLEACSTSCLDVLELGFPSLNPYSDGPVIAKAHSEVNHGIACSVEYWEKIRAKTDKPIWLMAYYDDFIKTDIYKQFAEKRLMDSIVIPDMSFEKSEMLAEELAYNKIDVVNFTNPGMDECELDKVFRSGGIIYEQLYVGQTGSSTGNCNYLPMLEKSLKYPDILAFAGFGISTFEHVVDKYRNGFDGVIIGTAIVKRLNESLDSMNKYLAEIGSAKELWH